MTREDEPAAGMLLDGRFELVREIGRGGMGVVFEATHRATGRRLAIKFLLPAAATDAEAVARFVREARAAAAIGDRHIVEVVDLGQAPSGTTYVALEYLDGHELGRVIDPAAPLAIERAAHIAYQLARAMGRAHARGIVHRDLKPANVFLVRDGDDVDYVKVLDFGIAKLQSHDDFAAHVTSLTRTGQVVGTPLYMSPEQLRSSRDVDARTDVYAIGVILYELLAGRLPFVADTMPELFLKIMTEESAPLATLRDGLPPELSALVARAMAREVHHRPRNGDELADELATWAADWRPGAQRRDAAPRTNPAPATTSAPTPMPTPRPVHSRNAMAATEHSTTAPPLTAAPGASTTGGVSSRSIAPRAPRRTVAAAAGLAVLVAVGGSSVFAWRALHAPTPIVTRSAPVGADASTVVAPLAPLAIGARVADAPDAPDAFVATDASQALSRAIARPTRHVRVVATPRVEAVAPPTPHIEVNP